ncbi:MAG: sugar transferase [Actinobacteria bacterium]|nr:sugar transferase [Actinomycetota bacterium]
MRTRFLVSVALVDLAALALAVAVASQLVFDTPVPGPTQLPAGASIWPLLGFMALSMILASIATEQMSGPGVPRPTYGRMLAILMGTVFLTAGFIVLFRPYWSRFFIGYSTLFWLVPATIHRFVRTRKPWTERIGIITAEKQLADNLADAAHAEVAWIIDPAFDGPLELPDRDTTIAVDLGAVFSERVAQYLSSCDLAGYVIRPFSSIYEQHTGRVPLVHVAEGWEISAPLLEVARWLPGKRVFDIGFTMLTIPLWVPLGLLVAGYVKLADPGFSVFRQRRVGLNGRVFTMFKFRTMVLGSESEGPRFAEKGDPRLIPGGAFLRKFRFDELPQLVNVLRGDMSLVGPRAEQVSFAKTFRDQIPFYDHRHLVRPGITGWAQVSYGYADDEAETIEKLTYDLYYIKHMSPAMDLRILWQSIWTVLTGAGSR